MNKGGKITNKLLILASSNILWGLIPLASGYLLNNYSSFTLIFFRFLTMTIFLIFTILILILIQKSRNPNGNSPKFDFIYSYLKSRNESFFSIPQWLYLLILSIFGLNFLTIFYFFGLKFLGAIITSIGIMFSLILSSIINWGMGKEQLTGFKQLYLFTLIGTIVILAIVSVSMEPNVPYKISWSIKFIVVIMFGLATTFFIISGSTDKISPIEIKFLKKVPNYQLLRTLIKLAVLSFYSSIFLILMLLLLQFIPFPDIIGDEITYFWIEIKNLSGFFKTGYTYLLIIGFTIFPYLIYYYSASIWPKNSSFDLWASVLQLLEPITTLFIGIAFLKENFPVSWFLTIVFMLIVGILMKFLSETHAQIYALFFIKIRPQKQKSIFKQLYSQYEVKKISSLIGEFDLMVYTQFPSSKSLNLFLYEIIQSTKEIQSYEMQIITEFMLDRS